jgi:hypothetical protein
LPSLVLAEAFDLDADAVMWIVVETGASFIGWTAVLAGGTGVSVDAGRQSPVVTVATASMYMNAKM